MTSPEREAAMQRMERAMARAAPDAHGDDIGTCARIAAEEIERVRIWCEYENIVRGCGEPVDWAQVCPEVKP